MAIQASSLPLLIALITGDLGSGSALLGTIPMSLVQNGYSRDHEREADEFALRVLRDHGINTQPLADLFEHIMQLEQRLEYDHRNPVSFHLDKQKT